MRRLKLDPIRIKALSPGKLLVGPRAVNIHLTKVCNLKCLFCWDHSPLVTPREKKRIYLNMNSLKNVIADCARIGVETICLEGGEVMLYPRIEKLFREIKSKGMNLEIYSNCTFSSEKLASFAYVDKVRVNLSAASSLSYQRIHGTKDPKLFRIVLRNLYRLACLKKQFRKPEIQLIFIVNKFNFREIEQMMRIAEKLGADELSFKLVEATSETKELILDDASLGIFKHLLASLRERPQKIKNNIEKILQIIFSPNFKKDCYAIATTARHNDRYFYYRSHPDKKIHCYASWFYGFIDEKGRVIGPCDNVGVAVLGNIHSASFKKIWFSKKFQRLRQEARRGINPSARRWQECRYCGFVDFNTMMSAALSTRPKSHQ
jgi:MoaA/NifB/PqqE/SkfB family radical SAM enzyme